MAENVSGEVIERSQQLTIDIAGKAFVAGMGRQTGMFDQAAAEVGISESVAGRYMTTGQPNAASNPAA